MNSPSDDVDEEYVADFFVAQASRGPSTPFKTVRRLEASHTLTVSMLNSVFGLQYAVYFMVACGVYRVGGQRVVEGTLSLGELVALVALLGHLEGGRWPKWSARAW